jgi:hypothetical protein
MKSRLAAVFALLALSLSACGGGGGGSSSGSALPPGPGASGAASPTPPPVTPTPVGATPSPTPIHTATPKPTPTPVVTPTPLRTATPAPSPVVTPTPVATLYPPDPPSAIRSTYGRIALSQIFDYFPSTGTQMSSSQIASDAYRYDWVWGSFNPSAWRSANSQALVSRYYIIEEDNTLISGLNLQWWEQNHPDWILYACDSSGNPTRDIAYTPGDGFADVPLNIHNPAVVQYQIQQSLLPYAQANGYNALALDEVIFHDMMLGGNPELGQTEKPGEFGCGTWNSDGTFNKVYQNPNDPTWTQDVLNWVEQAKQAASMANIKVVVNHPAGSITSPNEQTLMRNIDMVLVEAGFTNYGNYGSVGYFNNTYNYMEWVQKQGVAIGIVQKYYHETTTFTPSEIEYGIATYMMANEGNADMFLVGNNGRGYGYGAEQYHTEYGTQLGDPCGAMYGGNPGVYYRRFQNGIVVANASSSAATATFPSNHTYNDIDGRPLSNPMTINGWDGYVLITAGNGCQ